MKHIKLINEFEEFKKPSYFSRAVQYAKDQLGVENKEDRQSLDDILRYIKNKYVDSAKEIKPGVIVAWLSNKSSLRVDINDNIITYKGKDLQVKNKDIESDHLYNELKYFLNNPGAAKQTMFY